MIPVMNNNSDSAAKRKRIWKGKGRLKKSVKKLIYSTANYFKHFNIYSREMERILKIVKQVTHGKFPK